MAIRYSNGCVLPTLQNWLAGALCFIVTIPLGYSRYSPTQKVCISSGSAGKTCAAVTLVFIWSFVFAGVIVPMVLFVIMYLKGRQLDKKLVTSKEMETKRLFNKRIFRTFFILLIVLVDVSIIAAILLMSPTITLAFYIIQVLIGHTVSDGITVVHPSLY